MAFNPVLNLGDLNGRNGFVIKGLDISLGWSVSNAGDVNADGLDDVILSGSGEQDYVIFGSNQDFGISFDVSEIDGSNGFVIEKRDDSFLSWSVSGAGDVNGDGIDDIIIGAPFAASGGESYVVFGRNQGLGSRVNISDLDGSNGFVIENRNNIDLSFGRSVSGAGDINGDGTDEIIIGSPWNSSFNNNVGSYVVFGNDQGFNARLDVVFDLNGSNGFGIAAIDWNDNFGRSVSGAGDINGDGIDDIIIGASNASSNDDNLYEGQSYVVFGSSQGFDLRSEYFNPRLEVADLNGSNGFVINGIDENDGSGVSVSGAGDINGDGIDDIIIGAFAAEPNGELRAGESYVVFGSDEGFSASLDLSNLNGSNGFVINGIDEFDVSGLSVSGAGDINGDGFDDIIIGAPGADPHSKFFAGKSYVVLGSDRGFSASLNLSELDGSNGFVIKGIEEWNFLGWSVSGAGDINGDGFDDLIIGASGSDPSGYESDGASEAYVVFGMPQGNHTPTAVDDTFTLDEDVTATFDVLRNDTDLNGDRITINSVTQPTNGIVSVNSGNSLTYTPNSNFTGNDSFIYEISDGNSTDTATVNLTVVAGEDPTTIEFNPVLNLSDLNGRNGFVLKGIDERDFSGSSVSSAGDINGDGFDDIIIGAGSAKYGDNFYGGQSYVVFGSDQGFNENLNLSELDGRNGFAINGGAADFSGYSVSGAGDVNGDGIDDVIIGSPLRNNYNTDLSRSSYVIFGSNQGFSANLNLSELDGRNGFIISFDIDPSNSGRTVISGSSVSSAGDINGDGFDDLIIGAPRLENDRYSHPNFHTGESYVVFGSDQDFSANLNLSEFEESDGFVLTGIDGRDFSGSSVSGAGDFNGDGFDDLIIGAPDADPNDTSAAGESYLVFGREGIFSQSLNNLNGNNGFVINGINEGDNSGVSVSGAGDVNGDGFDDVIIGAHRTDIDGNLSVGESYVVFGSDQDFNRSFDLADLNGNNGFAIKGVSAGDFAGRSVSAAGDINNDGFDDLIIGAQGADPNGNLSAGESYVVLGQAQGFGASLDLADLNGRNGFTIKGIDRNDSSGRSVSGAGDINGDGTDDVIIGAPGGNDSAGESYVILGINPDSVNNPPVAADDVFTTEENIAVTFDVLSNDSDPDSDRINISSIIQPVDGGVVTFSDDGQALIYTPSIDFSGTDTFTYTITDGLDTDTATVTITIEPEPPVNTAPNTVDDQSSTAFNTSVTVNVLDNDTDSENDLLSIESFETRSANNGSVTLSTEGQALIYTPSIDFSGTDTFTYIVTDGTETDTATVTVTVNPDLDQPPVVANAIADFEVEEGSGNRVFDLSTLFTDPDNDDVFITKTLISNSNPNLVEAIINDDVFTLNFQPGETGSTEITIEGRSNGKTVTDTFTATITEIDEVDAPLEVIAPIPNLEVEQDSVNQFIDLSTIFTDPDNDDIAITKEISDNNNPDLIQVVLEGNLLTLDFQPGQSGTADLTILATSNGETLTNTFTVTVNPIPEDQPPIVANPIADITVNQGSPETFINLADVFTDPDNDDFLITSSILSNSNSNLVTPTISENILELAFDSTEFGSTNLVIEATSNNQTITDEVTITVNAVTPTPVNTPTPTPTPTPIDTPTPTPVNTPTPTPINSPTPTPNPIDTPTPVNIPTPTPVNSPTPTPNPIDTPTPVNIPTPTPVNSPTPTPNPIDIPVNRVDSPTPTPINTPTYTPIDPTIFVPPIQDPNIAPNLNPAETINIVASSDPTVGSDNADNIFGSNTSDIIFAQKGTDFVEGSNGNETIFGGQGNDLIIGGLGNDSIFGNWGNDIVSGGEGNDWMNGNQENDFLNGGEGSDTVFGGKQNDTLQGEGGNDELFGNLGNDLLEGNEGDDFLYGGQEADTVSGNGGNDVVSGDLGSDLLDGNAGEDTVTGGEGDDTLDGGEGDDNLDGGEGNDQLVGAGGNDIVRGGGGSDQFVLFPGDGTDTIVDFEVGIDRIGLIEGLTFTDLTLTSGMNEVSVNFGEETLATVLGVNTLTEADFEFV